LSSNYVAAFAALDAGVTINVHGPVVVTTGAYEGTYIYDAKTTNASSYIQYDSANSAKWIQTTAGTIIGTIAQNLGTSGTTVAANAHLGSTGTATLDSTTTDGGGQVILTPGGTSIATGIVATVTYGTAKSQSHVVISAANTTAAGAFEQFSVQTTERGTGFDIIVSGTALGSGSTYVLNYVVGP
jgi:hypothetical protein